MRPVILISVFLVVTYCCGVLSVKFIRQQPSNDLLKLTSTRKSEISKRRFRRDAKVDDPDVFNVNKEEGRCNNPAEEDGREITKLDVSLNFH